MNSEELEMLVARIQQGKTNEYEVIISIFQQPIFRYCYRLLENRQDAEDAVQDILVKAYQSLHQYKRADHFSAWLYRIAYHYCLNLLRRRHIHRKVISIISSQRVVTNSEEELDEVLYKPVLVASLSRLSLEERNLLILRVFEEKSFAEISSILKVSSNALVKRMKRIQKKVRKYMESEEGMIWTETEMSMNTKI
ncbi:RNA polymerase sigma factor [Paenibacillus illinoisensis]|uniref:RNA polymerase ecf-type sigma factor n=1 Tax=Paenibacillus illinoisensis TaxID=59845 RepID=A0A2W0C6D9_9BACL|nr:RNA polymerase sigma factor [Paenibacillus illinoisensis]PYY27916.1 RNA polymerase ecf-type sigma factor [Paenibacillus illinoisensis]